MPQLGERAPIGGPDTPLMLIGREPGPDDSYGRTAPDQPLPRDANDASLWLPGQGQANSCGTTTLSYVMRYLIGPRAPGCAVIDDRLRRGNIFSAPMLLAAYARAQGLAVRVYNRATTELVFHLVGRGVPVMILMDTTPLDLRDTANLHWVCLVSHHGDEVGIYNPHGFQEALDLASFEAHWREARLFGIPAWRNFAIAIGRPGQALPARSWPGLSALGANCASNGVARVVNSAIGVRRLCREAGPVPIDPGIALEAARVLLGALQTVVGGLLMAARGGAEAASRALSRRRA